MLDRDEIEKRLTKAPPAFVAAFAVRSAMLVLPYLTRRQKTTPFWFWKENSCKHLFSLMHIERTVTLLLTIKRPSLAAKTVFDATKAVSAAADTADTDAVRAAFFAARAILAATGDAAASIATTAASAASYVRIEYRDLLLHELNLIAPETWWGKSKPSISNVSEYLQKPLWLRESPDCWQKDWRYFKRCVLRLDTGFSGFLDWFDARIAGEPINMELLEKQVLIPEEILSQDVASINAYLNSLVRADKTLNRVRAIFMGHGTAGKTSLVRCIQNEKVIEGKEDMTPGIDIREWPLPDSPIKALLWDFGGQVIAHATHQFFLRSGCLYVLVIDARAEINATEQAQYWLEHVKAFAGSAPVMLVGNKSDLLRINPDLETLIERYPNITGFYNLSCTKYKAEYKPEFEGFMRDFIQQLRELDLHQVKFMDAHFNAMDALRAESRQQAFLTQAEFNQFCTHAGVTQEGPLNQKWLLDTLDKLGVIIHFPDLPFHDAFVLNPRWLTYGVYTLLYSQEAKEHKGQITKKQVITILQQEEILDEQGHHLSYPADKCGFIIEAMRSFKLCYYLKNSPDTLVIPDLLPSERPPLDFDKTKTGIVFEFRFPHLLPRHVMPMFIVFRHDDIEDNQVWQTGVVLRNHTHSARALVSANYSDRVITLHVQGAGAKDYLHILHDEIIQIVQKLKDLPYEEWVELPQSAIIRGGEYDGILRGYPQEKADYRQLLGTLRANHKQYISSSGVQYDLYEILGGIMTDDKLEKATGGGFTINGSNNVVRIENAAIGNTGDVNINHLSQELLTDFRRLIDAIKIEIEDNHKRSKALRELELMREQIPKACSDNAAEKQEAKAGLKELAEKFKSGTSYTAQVTKDISSISDKLPGLVAKVMAFISL